MALSSPKVGRTVVPFVMAMDDECPCYLCAHVLRMSLAGKEIVRSGYLHTSRRKCVCAELGMGIGKEEERYRVMRGNISTYCA